MKEKRYILSQGIYRKFFYGEFFNLCVSGVRRKVALPEDVRTIDVVFTKRKKKDSFTLVSTKNVSGKIKEWYGKLNAETEMIIEGLYAQGYRYVHVEYAQ